MHAFVIFSCAPCPAPQVRRQRRLEVSFISTIANYEYAYVSAAAHAARAVHAVRAAHAVLERGSSSFHSSNGFAAEPVFIHRTLPTLLAAIFLGSLLIFVLLSV